MKREASRLRTIPVLTVFLALALPVALASTVTLTPGVEILQTGNDVVFQVDQEFNTSTLTAYNYSTNFGGVNFSIPHSNSNNATVNISEFNSEAVQGEVVADFKINTTAGDTVNIEFSNLTSRRYYQLYLDGVGLTNASTEEDGNYSYTVDYSSQGFKDFQLKALVRERIDLTSSISGDLNYKPTESYTVSGSAQYEISGDPVVNTTNFIRNGVNTASQQTDSNGDYSFSLTAPKVAGNHEINTTISEYGIRDSEIHNIKVTALHLENPKVTSVGDDDRYIDIDDQGALNISAKVYRNTDDKIDNVGYTFYDSYNGPPISATFEEWADLENTSKRTETQVWYNTTPALSNYDEFDSMGNYTVRFDANSELNNGTTIYLNDRSPFNITIQNLTIDFETDQESFSATTNIDNYVNITGQVLRQPNGNPVSGLTVNLDIANKSTGNFVTLADVTTNGTGHFNASWDYSDTAGIREIRATAEDSKGIDGKSYQEFTVTELSVDSPTIDNSPRNHSYNISAVASDTDGITDHTCNVTVSDGEGNRKTINMTEYKSYGTGNEMKCGSGYVNYDDVSGWKPTEVLSARIKVWNGSLYAANTIDAALPNHEPSPTQFTVSGIEDRYAFNVEAVAEDTDGNNSEIETCKIHYYDSDGNSNTKTASLDTGYGTSSQASCTYEINTSLQYIDQQEDVDVEVEFVDRHGKSGLTSRKTGSVVASMNFDAEVTRLDGTGLDTAIEFKEPGTNSIVTTLSDSSGSISGTVAKGTYDVNIKTLGVEFELNSVPVKSDKSISLEFADNVGNRYDDNVTEQYVREFKFVAASKVGLSYDNVTVRHNYGGHTEKYIKPWVCSEWNQQVEYRECRQDSFPYNSLSYSPVDQYGLNSAANEVSLTSTDLEGAYVFAENKGWRTGWFYRNELTINGGDQQVHDYQVKLTVNTRDLILNGTLDEGCNSIRFYDTDQKNQLDYWMEPGTCDTESTEFWVEVPYIPANSDKAIFMYYSNGNLSSKSSGQDTFVAFDEFNTSLGTGYDTSGNLEVENGYLSMTSQNSNETAVTYKSTQVTPPYRTYARVYREGASEEAAVSTQVSQDKKDAVSYRINSGVFNESYSGSSTTVSVPGSNWIEFNQSITSISQSLEVEPSGASGSLSASLGSGSYYPFAANLTEDSGTISEMRVERWFTTNYVSPEPGFTDKSIEEQWTLTLNGSDRDISVNTGRTILISLNSSENPSAVSLYINGNRVADSAKVEGILYKADNLNSARSYKVTGEIEKFDKNISHDIVMGQDDKSPLVSLTGASREGTNKINFTFNVEDNYQGSADCSLSIDGQQKKTSTVSLPLDNTTYSSYYYVTSAPHGENQYNLTCTDQSGNSNSIVSTYSEDFKAPRVDINSPSPGEDKYQERPRVNFTATDSFTGTIDYEVYFESEPGNSVTGTVSNSTSKKVTLPKPNSFGRKEIVVKATDNRGYTGSSSVTIDLFKPEIDLMNPPKGSDQQRVIHQDGGGERTISGDRYEVNGNSTTFEYNYTNFELSQAKCRLKVDGNVKASATVSTNTVQQFSNIEMNDGIAKSWKVECKTETGNYVSSPTRYVEVDTEKPGIESVRFLLSNGTEYGEDKNHRVRVKTTDNIETPSTSAALNWPIDNDCVGGSKGDTFTDANPYLEMNGQDDALVMKHNFTGSYSNETISLDTENYRIESGCLDTTTKSEPRHYAQESYGSLEPGKYKFKYWIKDEGGNVYESQTRIYSVTKGDPGLSISTANSRANDNLIVRDTSPKIRCSVTTDQVTTKLYRNGLQVDSSSDGTTLRDNSDLPAGTYTYQCNSSATGNFSSDSVTRTIEVKKYMEDEVTISVNGRNANRTFTYGTEPTIKADSRSGTEDLYIDGQDVSETYTKKFAAGTYNLFANSSGSYRFNESNKTRTMIIAKATPSVSISSTNGFEVARGINPTLTCTSESDTASMTVSRDGTQVASGTSPVSFEVNTSELGTGSYDYSCDVGSSANYTSNSKSRVLRVYKAPAPDYSNGGSGSEDATGGSDGVYNDGFSFSGSSVERDIVRGTKVNVTCDTTQDVPTTLYHDGTEVSSPFTETYVTTGDHTLECVTEETVNYRSTSKTINYDVMNRTSTTLYLGGISASQTVDQDEDIEIVGQVNVSGTTVRLEDRLTGDTLWRDDDGKANRTVSFDVPGTHDIEAVHPEEDDFFASSDTETVTVNDVKAPRITLNHPSEGEILDHGNDGDNDFRISWTSRDYSGYSCTVMVNGSAVAGTSENEDDSLETREFSVYPSRGSGVYNYKVACEDNSGNRRVSNTVQFRLDNSEPSLTVQENSQIDTGDPTPSITVNNSDVSSRQVTVQLYRGVNNLDTSGDDNLEGGTLIAEKTFSQGTTGEIVTDSLSPGLYKISTRIVDEVGNDRVSFERFKINISDDVLIMQPNSQGGRNYIDKRDPELSFKYYSDTSPRDCTLYLDGVEQATYTSLSQDTWKNYSTSSLGDGRHTWNVTCNGSPELSNQAEFWIDIQEPTVQSTYVSKPSGHSYTGEPITYSVDADEDFELKNATFTYASQVDTKLMDCNDKNVCTTSVSLQPGQHHYNYTLCDTAGNCYTTDTSSYTITDEEGSMNLYLNNQEDNITITDNPVVNVTGEFIQPKEGTIYFYVNGSITGRCDRGTGCTIQSRFLNNGTYKIRAEFYSYADSTTDADTYWVNAEVPESAIQAYGYNINNLPSGKNASLRSNPVLSLLVNGVKNERNVLLGNGLGQNLAAQLRVNFDSDLDASDISFDTDRDLRKSYVHLARSYGQVQSKTLLVPRIYDTGQVTVCPGADSLGEVNYSCPQGYNISTGEQVGSVTMQEVNINGQKYYELSGIQGTGGQEVLTDQWNTEPDQATAQGVETLDEYENIVSPDDISVEGGNVTQADLSGSQPTDDWAGVFGNATGHINLGSEKILYRWKAQADLVFAANESVDWNQLEAANLTDVDSYYGFGDQSADAETTFANETDIDLERITLENVSSAKTYNGTGTPVWVTGALTDGENPVFAGKVYNNGSTAFTGEVADYQMMVPVPNERLIPYALYVDLK